MSKFWFQSFLDFQFLDFCENIALYVDIQAIFPEGDIFPAVDEDVDRAVEDEEPVGDVADDGAPERPLPLPRPPPHRPGHLGQHIQRGHV